MFLDVYYCLHYWRTVAAASQHTHENFDKNARFRECNKTSANKMFLTLINWIVFKVVGTTIAILRRKIT